MLRHWFCPQLKHIGHFVFMIVYKEAMIPTQWSLCLYVCPSVCWSFCPSDCSSSSLFVLLTVRLSFYLFLLTVRLSFYLSFWLLGCLSVCPSVLCFFYLSVFPEDKLKIKMCFLKNIIKANLPVNYIVFLKSEQLKNKKSKFSNI